MTMNTHCKTLLAASLLVLAGHASAQVTFYEGEGYRGRAFTTSSTVPNFARNGFNDRASSVVVDRGRWEVCEDAGFRGRCVVLRRGSYESLAGLGLQDRISSVRPVNGNRRFDNEAPEPVAAPNYDYRRRANERVFEAPVTSARAVVGAASERCWIERQQVSQPARSSGGANVGGAIVGGLLGGVLGHQVGGGTGKDIATVGGAVAGAAVGSQVGRSDGNYPSTQDVRRCENVASTVPTYWDVTYDYRGVQHRVQTATDPGRTIAVNQNGEPRM
ncbi:MAG: beta/gamma crystallin-related protein [Pseudomonadota bacterium]